MKQTMEEKDMEILVQRDLGPAGEATNGRMWIDGVPFAFTLEPRRDQSKGKPYCIPAGRYRVFMQFSKHFGYPVPMLDGVPGFEAIEIHVGNYASDTHGCTLIGYGVNPDWTLAHSAAACRDLYAKIHSVPASEQVWITYKDPMAEAI